MEADKPNANGWIYPRHILEENIKRLEEQVKNKQLLGELDADHYEPYQEKVPAELVLKSIIKFANVSHMITDMRLEGNDLVIDYTVLQTPMGKLVKALMDDKVKLQIVPRGIGSVKDGVVQPNYKLITFDITA